jgi:uncharacterized membrane protein
MKKPLTIEEIKNLRESLRNVNKKHREKLSSLELFAMWITEKVGTMGFFFIILLWTIVWLSWNTLGPAEFHFDPYPAFVLWLFISNTIQLFLMPLLLIGQNLQGKHAEARAEADFEINRKSEKEIETILLHLENQNEILDRLEKK